MAHKAGFKEHNGMVYVTTINNDCAKELKAFEALVRADERKACAKMCEDLITPSYLSISEGSVWDTGTLMCADAIRARSNT
jgi:hypothetical protein